MLAAPQQRGLHLYLGIALADFGYHQNLGSPLLAVGSGSVPAMRSSISPIAKRDPGLKPSNRITREAPEFFRASTAPTSHVKTRYRNAARNVPIS